MNEEKIDLIEEFVRVQWLFHRYHQRNHTHYGPMGDPTRGQGRVLTILKMKPEISQKDLSYLLDMRPQSLGEILSKLEKSGYITRTPSETDRRVMNIKLTKEGIAAIGATEQEFSFDKLFECLSQEEQKNLSGYLRRVIETLEAQIGDEQPEPEPDFDPRERGGNQFDNRFDGHSNWAGGRGDSNDGQFDPHLEMGWNRPGKIPFGRHPGYMPFDRRSGMSRGHEEHADPSQKKPDEE